MLRNRSILRVRTNQHRWLLSYADFVTLLFAFFVVMFAVAQTSSVRAHDLVESIHNERPVKQAAVSQSQVANQDQRVTANDDELAKTMVSLSRQLRPEIASGHMQMHLEARGLVVSLSQAAYFPSGGDRIEPSCYPSIEKVADAVRSLPNSIRLEGHTDSQPLHRSRFEDNWALSAARALAMAHVLNGEAGIDRNRLAIAGFGDTVPIASNDTEEGRASNRRVDIVILRPLETALPR